MEDVILLDTGILIDYLCDGPLAEGTEEILLAGKGAVAAITVYELFRGVKGRKHREQRSQLLSFVHKIDLNEAIARKAGSLYTELRTSGLTVDHEDILTGATALHYGMEIFTINKKHFAPIPGVRLYSPHPTG